jgi:hypothetical protein
LADAGLFRRTDEAIARAWMANISQQPADKRTAHLLCELRHRLALVALADQYRFPLPLTQQDLPMRWASLSCTSIACSKVSRDWG